jgi:serine/threonine-protein kinase RsbW
MKTELCLPSDLKYLPVVEHWLLESLKLELGDSEALQPKSSHLRLVLAEAYSNVVVHAHKKRSEIPVSIQLELKDNELILTIWDSGNGFNTDQYSPPQPNTLQEGGYGWLIINRLMDKVEYTLHINGRNCLQMKANLDNT